MTRFRAFNERVAVAITSVVGTMTCAYAFAVLAMVSLPAAFNSGSMLVLVSWIAQTFLQLVLLSVIMVGSSLSAAKTEAVILATHAEATELIADVHSVLADLTDSHADTHTLLQNVQAIMASLPGTSR